jgi:tripartite-type tricarboxylate transporter receptor subunit TctC
VVDNRAGAGGLVAFEMVAKANADGHTLLAASPSFAIQPSISASLPYDPVRDFAPVTQATSAPYLLVVYPGVEAKSVKELIALAKANPGKLNYASGGVGSAPASHRRAFPAHGRHRYRARAIQRRRQHSGPARGRVQMLFSGLPQALAHVQAGRLRPLAVTTIIRSPVLPLYRQCRSRASPFRRADLYGIFTTGATRLVSSRNCTLIPPARCRVRMFASS